MLVKGEGGRERRSTKLQIQTTEATEIEFKRKKEVCYLPNASYRASAAGNVLLSIQLMAYEAFSINL